MQLRVISVVFSSDASIARHVIGCAPLGEGHDAQAARGRSNLMTADTFSGL